MRKRLALLLIVPFLTVAGTTVAAHADCGSSSVTGGNNTGTWTKTYDANCAGNNTGQITVSWSNGYLGNGDRYVKYDISIWAGNLGSNRCIQLALDWNPVNILGAGHSDAQIMRNCVDHSTENMTAQVIDVSLDPTQYHPIDWTPLARLQVSNFDRNTLDVAGKECPTSVAPRTDTTDECINDWEPDGVFSSFAAKIRRNLSSGTDQNIPVYPTDYWVDSMLNANG